MYELIIHQRYIGQYSITADSFKAANGVFEALKQSPWVEEMTLFLNGEIDRTYKRPRGAA